MAEKHSFDTRLAELVGIPKAIIIGTISYWTESNQQQKLNQCYKEGKWWTWLSRKNIHDRCKYLPSGSVGRWLIELEKDGWIESKVFTSNLYSMSLVDTKAYTLTLKSALVQNEQPPVQNEQPPVQNEQPPVQNEQPPVQNEQHNILNNILNKNQKEKEYTPTPKKSNLVEQDLPSESNDFLDSQREILLKQKAEAEKVLSLKSKLTMWESSTALFNAIRKEYDDEIETQDVKDVKKQYQLQGMTFDIPHLENMLDTFCRKIIDQDEQVNVSLKIAKSRFFTSFIKNMSRFSPQVKKEEQKPSETISYLILRNNLDKLLEQGTITEKEHRKQMNCFRDKVGTGKTVTAEYFQTILKTYAQ